MRKAAGIGAIVLGLLLMLVMVVPTFVDLGRFKRTYLPLVEDTLHRRVDVDEVRLSLLPTPSIKLSKLRVSDSPAFPDHNFFAAQQVQLRLKLWPLLRGRFEITEFVLEKPVLNLLKQSDGTFNYSDIAAKKIPTGERRDAKKRAAAPKTPDSTALPLLVPARMRINDGQLNIITAGRKPVRIDGIALSMQDFSSDRAFPYSASFDYPGLKTISLAGQLDYQEEQGTLKLKSNRLKIQDLTLPLEGSVSNLSSAPRVNLSLADDNTDAKAVFQILSVFGLAPQDIDISGPMALRIGVTGLSSSLESRVQGQFKDVKVHGKRALKGNLTGGVSLRLPLAGGSEVTRRLKGEGKLVATDGELTNVDLIKKIQRITGMIGFSQDERRQATTFKTLEAEFTVANGLADFQRIHLVNPQLDVSGNGTMSLDQPTLNMALEATLSPQTSARTSRGKTVVLLKDNRGQIVVPLKITGRVENPSVSIDGEKMAQRGIAKSVEKSFGSFFKQLFRR
ncbi:MAG: AsmA family protein [Candidatus Binatia bacterium]